MGGACCTNVRRLPAVVNSSHRAALVVLLAATAATQAGAACKMEPYAELPVTVADGRVLIDATINGGTMP